MSDDMKLDTAFSNDKWAIEVFSVGGMIDELSRLPRDMPLSQGSENYADLVVLNRCTYPVLGVEEGGIWTGEEE